MQLYIFLINVNYHINILRVNLKIGDSTEIISKNCRHACISMVMKVIWFDMS